MGEIEGMSAHDFVMWHRLSITTVILIPFCPKKHVYYTFHVVTILETLMYKYHDNLQYTVKTFQWLLEAI